MGGLNSGSGSSDACISTIGASINDSDSGNRNGSSAAFSGDGTFNSSGFAKAATTGAVGASSSGLGGGSSDACINTIGVSSSGLGGGSSDACISTIGASSSDGSGGALNIEPGTALGMRMSIIIRTSGGVPKSKGNQYHVTPTTTGYTVT